MMMVMVSTLVPNKDIPGFSLGFFTARPKSKAGTHPSRPGLPFKSPQQFHGPRGNLSDREKKTICPVASNVSKLPLELKVIICSFVCIYSTNVLNVCFYKCDWRMSHQYL